MIDIKAVPKPNLDEPNRTATLKPTNRTEPRTARFLKNRTEPNRLKNFQNRTEPRFPAVNRKFVNNSIFVFRFNKFKPL